MKYWVTEITALDPKTNEMKKWGGDNIQAPTKELAQEWCNNNYKGYLKVIGELVAEIPCKEGGNEPDISRMIDYENIQNN